MAWLIQKALLYSVILYKHYLYETQPDRETEADGYHGSLVLKGWQTVLTGNVIKKAIVISKLLTVALPLPVV